MKPVSIFSATKTTAIAKFITAAMLVCLSAAVQAAEYVFDKKGQHVFITFKASHLGYSYILGHFEDFDGRFTLDETNVGKSSAHVTIQVASLDTDHAERDKHLKSADYFDADKYPTITFNSTGYRGNTSVGILNGKLNLHGVTKEVKLSVKKIGEGKDPWGGYRSGFEGTTTLKAAEFGFPAYVGDVEIYVVVEGIREPSSGKK